MGGTHASDSHPIFWNSVMQDLLASCYGFEDVSIVVCVTQVSCTLGRTRGRGTVLCQDGSKEEISMCCAWV